MSAIINSIIARQTGQASVQVEARTTLTAGHRVDEPGLRGHSVGDNFPYGVTGYGDRWAVTKHGAPLLAHYLDNEGRSVSCYRLLYTDHEHASLSAATLKLRDNLGRPNVAEAVTWDDYATRY